MCVSASSNLRVYPLAGLPPGLGKLAGFWFHPDPNYRQGRESTAGIRGESRSSLPPADPRHPLAWPSSSWHRKAQRENPGPKTRIPTVEENTVTDHHNLMKKENSVRNTFLNAKARRCGTQYKALKEAPASSLTLHTWPEL